MRMSPEQGLLKALGFRPLLFSHQAFSPGGRVQCPDSCCSVKEQPPHVYFNPRPCPPSREYRKPPARCSHLHGLLVTSKSAGPTLSRCFSPAEQLVVQPSWFLGWQFRSSNCLGQKWEVNLAFPSCCMSKAQQTLLHAQI